MAHLPNTTTPSAASLLIDALLPKQRALLHPALNGLDCLVSDELYHELGKLPSADTKMYINIYQRVTDEIATIKKILFADAFPEDLYVMPYILAEVKAAQIAVVS